VDSFQKKKSVDIDRRRALIPKNNRSTVDIDRRSVLGLKKLVNIDLTEQKDVYD